MVKDTGLHAAGCISRHLFLVLGIRGGSECRNKACWEASRGDNNAWWLQAGVFGQTI